MRLSWLFCLLAVLSLSVSGCGGEDEPASPLSTAHLHAMVLVTSEGLPWQVSLQRDHFKPNDVAADEFPDADQWLSNYEEWGRESGYSAEFQSEGEGILSVETEAESYSSGEGATSAWAAIRGFLLSDEMLRHLEENLNMVAPAIEEVGSEKVGDESRAFRMTTMSEGETIETFVVLFRRDRVVASAAVGAEEDASCVDDAAVIAKQLDGRIQAILELKK